MIKKVYTMKKLFLLLIALCSTSQILYSATRQWRLTAQQAKDAITAFSKKRSDQELFNTAVKAWQDVINMGRKHYTDTVQAAAKLVGIDDLSALQRLNPASHAPAPAAPAPMAPAAAPAPAAVPAPAAPAPGAPVPLALVSAEATEELELWRLADVASGLFERTSEEKTFTREERKQLFDTNVYFRNIRFGIIEGMKTGNFTKAETALKDAVERFNLFKGSLTPKQQNNQRVIALQETLDKLSSKLTAEKRKPKATTKPSAPIKRSVEMPADIAATINKLYAEFDGKKTSDIKIDLNKLSSQYNRFLVDNPEFSVEATEPSFVRALEIYDRYEKRTEKDAEEARLKAEAELEAKYEADEEETIPTPPGSPKKSRQSSSSGGESSLLAPDVAEKLNNIRKWINMAQGVLSSTSAVSAANMQQLKDAFNNTLRVFEKIKATVPPAIQAEINTDLNELKSKIVTPKATSSTDGGSAGKPVVPLPAAAQQKIKDLEAKIKEIEANKKSWSSAKINEEYSLASNKLKAVKAAYGPPAEQTLITNAEIALKTLMDSLTAEATPEDWLVLETITNTMQDKEPSDITTVDKARLRELVNKLAGRTGGDKAKERLFNRSSDLNAALEDL